MGNRRQFLYHSLIFGVGGALGQLVPMILFPLYTNYLTPAEYGIIDIIGRVSGIINTVLMIGGIRMAAITFFRHAESEEARRRVAVTISLLLWLVVGVSILLTWMFAGYIDVFLKIGDNRLLTFGLATSLLESLIVVPMTLTQARLESIRFVLTNMAMLLTRLGLCIYLIVWLELGIWGVLISQCIVTCVSSVLLTARELMIGSMKPDLSQWGAVFRFCWPFVPTGIIYFFYQNADRFFIINYGPYADHEAALAAVGVYALAFRLMGFTRVLGASPLQQVWSAQMYDIYKQPDAATAFGNFMLRILCVQCFFALCLSLFVQEIIAALCDPSYMYAAYIVPIAAFTSCLSMFNIQCESIFYITRKTIYKPLNNLVILPCIAIGMYFLVPRYGLMGAAIAFMISTFSNCLSLYFITQRFFKVKYPFKRMFVIPALACVCFMLSSLFGSGLNALTAEQLAEMTKYERILDVFSRINLFPILWKALCGILWLVLVWFSGALLKDDKEMLMQYSKKLLNRITRKLGKRNLPDDKSAGTA